MSAIGLYCYKLQVNRIADQKRMKLGDDRVQFNLLGILDQFFDKFTDVNTRTDLSRTWYVEPYEADEGNLEGLVKYGEYGFGSEIVDPKSKKIEYKRKVTDVQVIPLYYRVWVPKGGETGVLVLQSHEGRSCVGIVQEAIVEYLKEKEEDFRLTFHKILPLEDKIFADAPVKSVKLIKKKASGDLADRVTGTDVEEVDVELTISARRSGNFGSLKELRDRFAGKDKKALLVDGIEYGAATAKIRINGKYQLVGVLGVSSNAGVIDISALVERDDQNHPTIISISKVVSATIADLAAEYRL